MYVRPSPLAARLPPRQTWATHRAGVQPSGLGCLRQGASCPPCAASANADGHPVDRIAVRTHTHISAATSCRSPPFTATVSLDVSVDCRADIALAQTRTHILRASLYTTTSQSNRPFRRSCRTLLVPRARCYTVHVARDVRSLANVAQVLTSCR